jgi:hypothetical protein
MSFCISTILLLLLLLPECVLQLPTSFLRQHCLRLHLDNSLQWTQVRPLNLCCTAVAA